MLMLFDVFHAPLYTFIYPDIPLYIFKYVQIPLYTSIYFKISTMKKMRINVRHQNNHNSGSRASPRARIWHAPSYHIPRSFAMPKGAQS